MLGSRNTGQEGLVPMADINVTSLVDVAFTLLIIFIITAPILQGGIEVEVPETEVSSLTADDRTLIVTVDRGGIIYLAETAVDRAEFSQSFNQLVSAGNVDKVWIKGDSLATWGAGVDIMATVAASGVSFSVVAEQRPNN
ncbi:MAG TPA: biopolymer transporter ExbD [Gemmatimonadetes bacterium]|jgi:biopolymer transport protein ExbD|nr:biopolymer transporter ExbD [Gemmatimonadota bacterium]